MDSFESQSQDTIHFNATERWLELGNYNNACEEFWKISPKFRSIPPVLMLQMEICFNTEKWGACVEIATALIKQEIQSIRVYICRSYALHELKRTQEAFDSLYPASAMFKLSWLVRYNLACYCAQLGKLNEAQNWLKYALAINEKAVREIAFEDSDLKPLWESPAGDFLKLPNTN